MDRTDEQIPYVVVEWFDRCKRAIESVHYGIVNKKVQVFSAGVTLLTFDVDGSNVPNAISCDIAFGDGNVYPRLMIDAYTFDYVAPSDFVDAITGLLRNDGKRILLERTGRLFPRASFVVNGTVYRT